MAPVPDPARRDPSGARSSDPAGRTPGAPGAELDPAHGATRGATGGRAPRGTGRETGGDPGGLGLEAPGGGTGTGAAGTSAATGARGVHPLPEPRATGAAAPPPRCPACAEPFALPVELDALRHRTCGACGLQHAWPMESADAEVYGDLDAYGGDVRAAGAHEAAARRLDPRQRAWLEELHPRGRLLDLGCGRGALLAAAAARGQAGVGLEFQLALVVGARAQGLDVLRGDLREAPWPAEGSFAHVTAFEVLEHLPDPLDLVRRALGRLTPSGRLHLTVPTARRVPALHHPRVDAAPHHLTLWTEEALVALLRRARASDVVVERAPLHGDDLFLHHLWRRHGEGGGGWDRRDAWTRRLLHLRAAWLRRTGRARGHTLRAWAGPPRG